MDEAAARLYAVAKAMKGIETPSAVAEALGESHQTVTNWGRRGVSAVGALKAQQVFGCDGNWLLTGQGHVLAGWPFSPALLERVLKIPPEDRADLEVAMWAHLRERPPAELFDAIESDSDTVSLALTPDELQQVERLTHEHTSTRQKKRAA